MDSRRLEVLFWINHFQWLSIWMTTFPLGDAFTCKTLIIIVDNLAGIACFLWGFGVPMSIATYGFRHFLLPLSTLIKQLVIYYNLCWKETIIQSVYEKFNQLTWDYPIATIICAPTINWISFAFKISFKLDLFFFVHKGNGLHLNHLLDAKVAKGVVAVLGENIVELLVCFRLN